MNWRDPILAQFTPEIAGVARLTIVLDPDGIFTEARVVEGIQRRGFDLIPFDDAVAFRYAYESRFREPWDQGRTTGLVVVLRSPSGDANSLPWDLLHAAQAGHRLLSFSLPGLFPRFQPGVIAELAVGDLDLLHQAQNTQQPEQLGENATRDFVLRHVFGIAPEMVQSPTDLLRMLLQKHYRNRTLPASLEQRLVGLLSTRFPDWPLKEIVPHRSTFFAFLQERWPAFLTARFGPSQVREPDGLWAPRVPGPIDLPFDHEDVRTFMDNLFLEGLLEPSNAVSRAAVAQSWAQVGVSGEEDVEDSGRRLERLLERLEKTLPGNDADAKAWFDWGYGWAEAIMLRVRSAGASQAPPAYERLERLVEGRFLEWLLERYGSLHNLSHWPRPTVVHQVPRFMAHGFDLSDRRDKRALVVVDGMALDQWMLVRRSLIQSHGLRVDEGAVFAWVPTLTSVSRQALFAARPPFYFANSLGNTSREEAHWRRFWEESRLSPNQVAYVCQRLAEDDGALAQRVFDEAEGVRALGVVVGTLDRAIHGANLGTAGLHATLRHWAETGGVSELVNGLVERGFKVFLTADHGNVEARGIGKPNVGVSASERGERALVFDDDRIRQRTQQAFAGSVAWPSIGLPDDYKPLLAGGRGAFVAEGQRLVAHGGVAVEEVLVPFVRIEASS